ncbi:hypothetical protein Syun_007727 [Stephania yunnanensis]|uniref:Uncharacterized protein n=1 Tax=Stephania yunnanensis TaxID=152371 RepID=A0AAP0KZ86_9MAGN
MGTGCCSVYIFSQSSSRDQDSYRQTEFEFHAAMGAKTLPFGLLVLNLVLYVIVSIIAGVAINYDIDSSLPSEASLSIPAHIFPMYNPTGNMATGFFLIFSLIAGLVGIATSIAGIGNIQQVNLPNLHSAGTYSIITWGLTLLAMGLACKEINIGIQDDLNLLLCMGALNADVNEAASHDEHMGGGF